ncbi:hypothetical protein AB5567_06280 [Lactiplantibacillus plantarum]|uniref:hypothetical protein n=1 Tax=Lactiplantibacillus plantarum TaxID=1590 RepID=UPI000DF7E420|nr:hypothetical protein [Lactiplantibacillus plantarum]RDD78330.1 hypothetical protein DVV32_08155 [Lactiplantibacillus plantarum]
MAIINGNSLQQVITVNSKRDFDRVMDTLIPSKQHNNFISHNKDIVKAAELLRKANFVFDEKK